MSAEPTFHDSSIHDSPFSEVLKDFGILEGSIEKFGSGLINQTYLVKAKKDYILQNINTLVFKKPESLANNIALSADYLSKAFPAYPFIKIVKTLSGKSYSIQNGIYWRLQEFIKDSFTLDQANSSSLAFEAGKAVGEFTANLSALSTDGFEETIPNFHHLTFRFQQFQESIKNGNPLRVKACQILIDDLLSQVNLVETYENIVNNKAIPLRIQHHDTKISNVLFHKETEKSIGLCDMDTLMPGYFISDLGDMLRTYLCSFNEEHTVFSEIDIRIPYFVSVISGYLSKAKSVLNDSEKQYIYYAGEFMIYMQAMRFLTDYLNDDVYYGSTYEAQNLNRALNQMSLLNSYQHKSGLLKQIITDLLK